MGAIFPSEPDDTRGYLRGRVRAHRLAQAATGGQPVYLRTGTFAPLDARAIWFLPCGDLGAVEVTARQGDREITLRIVPEGEA